MTRKMYCGFAILILLIGTVAVFVIQHEMAENRELKDQLVEWQTLANQINQLKVSKNNPPPTEPGFKWVWHNDHWDKVPIDNPTGPIVHHDVPIADFPFEDGQTSEENDLYIEDNNPIDENFYREYTKKYSRERLEATVKSEKKVNEHIRSVDIPFYEKIHDQYLEMLKNHPDNEYFLKGLAEAEAEIKRFQLALKNGEDMIRMASNVLNEEVNNVEK